MSTLSWPMTGGSSGEHHLDFKPVDTSKTEDALRAAEAACQLAIEQIPKEVELSQELLIYPEGGVDTLRIFARDLEELQPEKDLGSNIVDFYIRFIERGLSPEHRKLLHFFNSYFFTKLLRSTTSTGIDPCKVDYEQLQRWTKEVNLFEKDYVFIPILKSSHWSLVIICNLRSLTSAPDQMARFPRIVHLDPIEGQHGSFECLIRSYVMQAWMERFQPSIYCDQLLALSQMKYVHAEVPKQDNSHDSGLYVLSYIEAFLVETNSLGFSFPSSEMCLDFTRPHLVTEVSTKRRHIQNFIFGLIGISRERARKCRTMEIRLQVLMQANQNLRACLEDEGREISNLNFRSLQLRLTQGNSQACTKDELPASPTLFNGQGCEINHASIHEDSMCAQHHQSSRTSRGNNEPLNAPHIEPMEYKNECERLSPKQQHAEIEVQIVVPSHFNGPNFEAKHASSHEDSIRVQDQQSSGVSRLDDGLLDGLEPRQVKFRRVTGIFSDKHQHPVSDKAPCVDLSEAVKGVNARGRNMTKQETSMLLLCKVQGGRFLKGSGGATQWNLISEEIGSKLGSLPSADQCRLRYDTVLKAYKTYKKYCMQTGKTFSEITVAERLELKPATTLSKEWYLIMDEICDKANMSQKRLKLSSTGCKDLPLLSSPDSPDPNPSPVSQGSSFEDRAVVLDSACGAVEVALRSVIPASVFSSFAKDLQSALLNLIQEGSLEHMEFLDKNEFDLEGACRRLAILQDRDQREILNYIFRLWDLKLVSGADMNLEEGVDLAHIDLWKRRTCFIKFEVYELFSKEVFQTNPHLKTYCSRFPIQQSSLPYIRVLFLHGCRKLKRLDMKQLPSLRALAVIRCPKFSLVTGWEVATGLGSLDIRFCNAYHDFPELRHLSSLREMLVLGRKSIKSAIPWHLSQLSQCAKLQRLEIRDDGNLSAIADLEALKELKFLEYLSLGYCTFSSIRGLSELQTLTTLHLTSCRSLRSVPELRFLTGLTHLDMRFSSVEDVAGVGELHLLTSLVLFNCSSLAWLPSLGPLKALVYLNLSGTGVEEIPGREDLIKTTVVWDREEKEILEPG